MPRPKRTKAQPSVPIKIHNQRVPKPAVIVSAAQKQKDIFSPASSGRITNGSDDSDGLVVAKRGGRTKTHTTPKEYTMSGALAIEDIGNTRLKPPSSKTRAELLRIAREADHAQAMEEARARGAKVRATEAIEARGPEYIPSSIAVETVSNRKNLGSSSSRQSSARQSIQERLGSRVQETPRMQSSILGGAAFKKRPRQPSLLQVAQSQDQTQLEVDDDDMYNFLPDDESTPLIKSLSQPRGQPSSSSSGLTSGSRKRKQKTPEIQVLASQSHLILPLTSPSPIPSPSIEQEDPYRLPAEEDQPQPSLPRHRSTQTPQAQVFSDTLAPPQSSSPTRSEPEATRTKTTKAPAKSKPQTQRPKRKEYSPAPSPLSSTSTQASPVRPTKTTKPLTTATLQNLLPQRRVRGKPKGDYDMPSSSDVELDNTGLGEHEDELSFHAAKVRRKKSGMYVPKSAAKRKDTLPKKASNTYTRKGIVVSEDEVGNDSASGGEEVDEITAAGKKKTPALNGMAKAEMKRLADKFREVDDYTLDFEDMTGGSSSQMKDAR